MKVLRLKEILEDRHLTASRLADSIGVTPNTISRIVQGRTTSTVRVLLKIANFLDIDIRELFHPNKKTGEINGLFYYKGRTFTIDSKKDLENLLANIKNRSNEL